MQNFYQEDLAYVHSKGYSNYAVEAAHLLFAKLSERNTLSGKVIDLGCGGGQLLAEISKKDYQTIGVEYSKDIIELAQQNAPNTAFHHGSIWDYEIPKCVAVTAIGEILTYAVDEKNSIDNIQKLFQSIYDQLDDQGIFMFDVLMPKAAQQSYDYKIAKEEEWTLNMEYHYDSDEKTLLRDITLFRKLENGLYRKSHEKHLVRLLEVAPLIEILEKIGFKCKKLDRYGDSVFRLGHIGVLATK